MKTLIDKLFERLGYVPIEHYEDLVNRTTSTQQGIRGNTVYYEYQDYRDGYEVYVVHDTLQHTYSHLIKRYPYTDSDSREYARICAEELCDMLNDKV